MSSKSYSLEEVYGIGEKPLYECPTYISKDVHKHFQYSVKSEKQHIVVYGASRQGKSWMVERYCPNFIRVGCDAKNTREQIFKSILLELDVIIGEKTVDSGQDFSGDLKVSIKGQASIPFVAKGEAGAEGTLHGGHYKNEQLSYLNIDLKNQSEVINAIKLKLDNRFIVIENFHYLNVETQKHLASSLREFLYHDIRTIIVGIWKETTKLASFVSDLSDRCEYFDIGDWIKEDLISIVDKGNDAMNTIIDEKIRDMFIENSGYNVGIFKSIVKNFYKLNFIYDTVKGNKQLLNDTSLADKALEKSFIEIINPVIDRLENLATSKKSGTKGMRFYIIKSILELMEKMASEDILKGINFQDIVHQVNEYEGVEFNPSNIKQELLQLHFREETGKSDKNMNNNLVPLFYFDRSKTNGKLFIVESALIAAKEQGVALKDILGSVENYI